MQRRTFLRALGAAAGTALIARPWRTRRSNAAPFGEFPTRADGVRLPADRVAKRVLEVFLYGGMTPWESLYLVRDYGTPASAYPNTQYWALDNTAALDQCAFAGGDIGQFFAQDALGADVELGPFARRLWDRPDVLSRLRLVVQKHTLEPHEAAVPQALTGRPVGQPSAAGLGTHVQRSRQDSGAAPDRASPWTYVFATGGISSDNVAAAAATGNHPGAARPLLIKTDAVQQLTSQLARPGAGDARAEVDAALTAYLAQYQGRTEWPGQGRVRAPRLADLAVAQSNLANASAIASVLDPDVFQLRQQTTCGITNASLPLTALESARHLLTHPDEPASYVCVSDTGLYEATGGGGYDTHSQNAVDTFVNFDNVLTAVLGIFNDVGENDPAKLNFDDTMVIFNTEFGRTPWAQDGGDGRNHHPYGYVTAMLGGPIGRPNGGAAGVFGAIGPDGRADTYATPAENRIAALLAMDIWPFSPDAFAVSDVRGANSELEAAELAMQRVLGVGL
jgi:hypothetical protein